MNILIPHKNVARTVERLCSSCFARLAEILADPFNKRIFGDVGEGADSYGLSIRTNQIGSSRLISLGLATGTVPKGTTAVRATAARMRSKVRDSDCVTFDLFDTLIERVTSEPSDVFRKVGLRVANSFADFEEFAQARVAAEKRARERSAKEDVMLDEIMAELRNTHSLSGEDITAIRDAELDEERRVIRVKPEGEDLYRSAVRAGRPVYILTDTYLPRDFIEGILTDCGYAGYDGLYVSSEARATKHCGTLFTQWQSERNAAARPVLHVGDNAHSDGDVPTSLGFSVFKVSRSVDRFLSHAKNRQIWGSYMDLPLPERLMLGVIACRYGDISGSAISTSQYLGSPYFLGYAALGPLLLGFTANLVRFSRQRSTSLFCFLSRDGYVFKAAYDRVAASTRELPESVYLAASRALCSAAGIDSRERVNEIASVPHHPMAIGDLLRHRFGYSESEIADIPESVFTRHGLTGPAHEITVDDPRKAALLSELTPEIIAVCSGRSVQYSTYLNSLGLEYEKAAVVDIGYAASSQRVISRLLGKPLDGAYLITSVRTKEVTADNLYCEGWLGDSVPLDHPFFDHVQNWEMMLSASHGSTIGVASVDDGPLRPVLDEITFDDSTRTALAAFHRGALDFVDDFLESHRLVFDSVEIASSSCALPLFQYFQDPDAEDCAAFSKAVFEDGFGGDTRSLTVPCTPNSLDLPAISKQVIWHEAAAAMAGKVDIVTPFYPAPLGSVIGGEVARQARSVFVDGFAGRDIAPSWSTPVCDATFDENGWPVAASSPATVCLVVPVTHIDSVLSSVIDSYRNQVFSGLSLVVTPFPNIGRDQLESLLQGTLAAVIEVSGWEDIPNIVRKRDEPWAAISDGKTSLDPVFSAEVRALLARSSNVDIVVVDDDMIDERGQRSEPHFKPEWSPELLLSTDYFGGVFVARSSLLRDVVTRAKYAGSWLWEVALQLSRETNRISRIPRILAHRSLESRQSNLSRVQVDANAVLARRFEALGANVQVDIPRFPQKPTRLACHPCFPDTGPTVAVIIPTKNQRQIVSRCLESLNLTTYENYQMYLVDNESDDPESLSYFDLLEEKGIRVLRIGNPSGEFSYSYVNNRAVEQTDGEDYLLFLNNDTEVIESRWLSQMVGWQQLPGVGSVGARLLFPNETVQHAGITHRLLYNVLPAPSFKCVSNNDKVYQDYIHLARNSAAQTAACLLTPRSVFLEHGMFDEKNFSVAYNDCDYGFRLVSAGLRNVYCGEAILYHHEGYSRGIGKGNDKPGEEAAFVTKYAKWTDPYYNPNLSLGCTDFSVKPTAAVASSIPRLRLGVVSHNLNYEGAPRVLLEIALGLQAAEVVDIVVLSPLDGPLRQLYEEAGCSVHLVEKPAELFRSGKTGLNAVSQVSALLTKNNVDVVLANTVLCWWAIEAAVLVRIPSVWIIHESEPPFTHLAEHSKACSRRGRRALALPYRVVFVSYATRDVFANLETTHNFHVFHNAIDHEVRTGLAGRAFRDEVRMELGLEDSTLLGLLPGAVCERKSQLDLVRALKLFDQDSDQKISFLILGDRPSSYSSALHAEISKLDPVRRDMIKVLPYSSGADRYFSAADFMISTSRIEAFPRIIQEAMCFGLPMVVAPVFGIAEQVQDEVSALFFPAGDVQKLSFQLKRITSEQLLRDKLGENARASLGRFPTMSMMLDEYTKIVQEAWLSRH